jgi:hypothetical protein
VSIADALIDAATRPACRPYVDPRWISSRSRCATPGAKSSHPRLLARASDGILIAAGIQVAWLCRAETVRPRSGCLLTSSSLERAGRIALASLCLPRPHGAPQRGTIIALLTYLLARASYVTVGGLHRRGVRGDEGNVDRLHLGACSDELARHRRHRCRQPLTSATASMTFQSKRPSRNTGRAIELRLHIPLRAWPIIVTRKRVWHIAVDSIVRLGEAAGTR